MDLLQKNGAQKDEVLLNQILELLLYGPLLSNTIVDWLDEFKDAYSSLSIDLLRNLLDIDIGKVIVKWCFVLLILCSCMIL